MYRRVSYLAFQCLFVPRDWVELTSLSFVCSLLIGLFVACPIVLLFSCASRRDLLVWRVIVTLH